MKKLTIACIAAAAMLFASCGTTSVESETEEVPTATTVEAPVYDGAWVVEEFVKDGAVVAGATANIELSAPVDGIYKLIGNAGVNSIVMTDFKIADGKIAPVNGALPTTMMAGTPEAMAYEAAFIDVLGNGANITLEGDKLVISNDTAKITFVAGAPAAAPIESTEAVEE